MKNLLILHGSYGNPHKNWYQHVSDHAAKNGYKVTIPQLPHIDELDLEETYKLLMGQNLIDGDTTMIGHSSGATYILGILQRLPEEIIVRKSILVGGFVDANLTDVLFKEVKKEHYLKLFPKKWDWKKIKKSCKSFVIFHSPTDPYVQTRHAEILKRELNGKLITVPEGKHFSTGTGGEKFREFPQLIEYLNE